MSPLSRLRRAQAERRLAATLLRRLFPITVRGLGRPTVAEMVGVADTADALLDELAPGWREFEPEFEALEKELEGRYRKVNLAFPLDYRIEPVTLRLLYSLVRTHRPRIVLESGVANGHSTVVLLNALAKNGSGRLHSVDIVERPGPLISDAERAEWSYHRLPDLAPRGEFGAVVKEIAPIDLFFHDSDHSYGWQLFEFRAVAPALAPGGLLVSDDVDYSYAFIDYCREAGRRPRYVFDERKVVGVLPS